MYSHKPVSKPDAQHKIDVAEKNRSEGFLFQQRFSAKKKSRKNLEVRFHKIGSIIEELGGQVKK